MVSVRTADGSGIEPIDSLQVLFNAQHTCGPVGMDPTRAHPLPFEFHPNPFDEVITFNSAIHQTIQVEILDAVGNQMYKGMLNQGQRIDVASFPKGIYFIQAWHELSGKSQVQKMIKR